MKPFQHPSNNFVFGAPKGLTPEQCSALPVSKCVYADGTKAIVSYWRPSLAEMRDIAKGHPVALVVLGDAMPMVSLHTDDPLKG